jgi:hypothetical protein
MGSARTEDQSFPFACVELIDQDPPSYLPTMTFRMCELRPTFTFLDRVCLTAASLLSFGFAHADPADDARTN